MATTERSSGYQRATDFSKGIGESLDKVAGSDMLLHDYDMGTRPMEGEQVDFVSLTLSTVSDPENKQLFHAWSQSLGLRLQEIPKEKLPVIVNFVQAKTRGGFKVWTIE